MPITTNMIKPGETARINGTVKFSRIGKADPGDATSIAAQQARGSKYPISGPFTTLTIENAQVLAVNPGQLTVFEQYLLEKIKPDKNTGVPTYYARRKGWQLPVVAYTLDEKNVSFYPLPEDGSEDLAPGLQVTLTMKCFGTTKGNNGISLEAVLVHGEVKLAPTSRVLANATADFAAMGLTIDPASISQAAEAQAQSQQTAAAPQPQAYAPTGYAAQQPQQYAPQPQAPQQYTQQPQQAQQQNNTLYGVGTAGPVSSVSMPQAPAGGVPFASAPQAPQQQTQQAAAPQPQAPQPAAQQAAPTSATVNPADLFPGLAVNGNNGQNGQ